MGFMYKFTPHVCDETVMKTLNGNFSSFNSSKYRNSYNNSDNNDVAGHIRNTFDVMRMVVMEHQFDTE